MAGEMLQQTLDIQMHDVDLNVGFMLQKPLEVLPKKFDPWNNLATDMPNLVKTKQIRSAVDQLPYLDHAQLESHEQLRLAHLQLSILASGYVWQDGEEDAAPILPKSIAVPLFHISQRLGIQPIISHVSLVLANWGLIDPKGGFALENLRCLYHLPGGTEADWFTTVTAKVELTFAKCLKPVLRSLEEIKDLKAAIAGGEISDFERSQRELRLSENLDEITLVIKEMQKSTSRMYEKLQPKTFFNVLRPLLGGWGGDGNPLPNGLIFEGVSDKPIQIKGASAAQSTTLQFLDAFLGVEHTQEKRTFLMHMRDFMLPSHGQLVQALEQLPFKLQDVVFSSKSSMLAESYNNCISAVIDFRSNHITVVTKYVVMAARETNEGNYHSLDDKGTGGTSIIPFLKDLKNDTSEKLISIKNGEMSTYATSSPEKNRAIFDKRLLLAALSSTLVVGMAIKLIKQ